MLHCLAAVALAALLAAAGLTAAAQPADAQPADAQEPAPAPEASPGSVEATVPDTGRLGAPPLHTGAVATPPRPLLPQSRHGRGGASAKAGAVAAARDGGRFVRNGIASWYGGHFHGRRTASGERFDMHAMTAAHRTLPMSSEVRIHNPANGRWLIVRINDRGPFHAGRMIDLSYGAALRLGLLQAPAMVEMWPVDAVGAPVRTGSGRNDGAAAFAALSPFAAAPLQDGTTPAAGPQAGPPSWPGQTALPASDAD